MDKQALRELCEDLIQENDIPWESKYKFVFNKHFHSMVVLCLNKLTDYHDPDTSYEEDTKAYLEAYL